MCLIPDDRRAAEAAEVLFSSYARRSESLDFQPEAQGSGPQRFQGNMDETL